MSITRPPSEWWTGIRAERPTCEHCSWSWRSDGVFEIKRRHGGCPEHGVPHDQRDLVGHDD